MMMKLRLLMLLVTAFVLPSCASLGDGTGSGVAPSAPPPANVLDDRELIVLEKRERGETVEVSQALGYELRRIDDLPALDDVLITLRIPEGTTIPDAIAEIEAAVPGVTAGAHHLYRLQATDAGSFEYANALIGWPARGCRAQMRIGMIDAGLSAAEVRQAGGRVVQENFVGSNRAPRSDHGALMASLLVGEGRVAGTPLYSAVAVDPQLEDGETAGVSAILRAISWLSAQNVQVVNISLAGPRNKLLNRGLGRAAEDGMILVAAAGNRGPQAEPQFPAAFPFVIAATAVDRDGAIYRRAVRGGHIDVAAPGVDIVVGAPDRLRVFSGTSAATAFVTGAIASNPALAGRDVEAARRTLTRAARDLGPRGRDATFGAGLLATPPACLDAS